MKFKKPSLSLVLAVFVCFSLVAAGTVSAAPISLPGYKNVNLNIANDVKFPVAGSGVYNFFNANQGDSQGLNALHIANNTDVTTNYGSVTNTNNSTGTLYLTDTGGRGWDDDGILMIAVNGTIPANFSITINSNGYNWTPVLTGSYPTYTTSRDGISHTFTYTDFNNANIAYTSTWKPSTSSNYPLYDGEIVSSSSAFSLIFVDLHAGIIGPNTLSTSSWNGNLSNVLYKGALQVNYTINNLPSNSMVTFNDYAFCNSSNQGQGIRWTNAVNQAGNNSGGVTSGYSVASWFNP